MIKDTSIEERMQKLAEENSSLRAQLEQRERDLKLFINQDREITDLLEIYTPRAFDYTCSVPGMQMSGFSIAQDGNRGGDLAFPILFLAPEDDNSYSMETPRKNSEALIHKIKHGPSRFGHFMADSTGHRTIDGIPASMLYKAARVAVNYELRERGDVSSNIARTLNDVFYLGYPSPRPISMLLSRFDRNTENLSEIKGSYILAGNPPPVLLREGANVLEYPDTKKIHISAPIGLFPTDSEDDSNAYRPNRFKLHRGDIMINYSDGLRDFGISRGELYFPPQGSKKLNYAEKIVLENRDKSAKEIASALAESILSHALKREDDITVCVFKAV